MRHGSRIAMVVLAAGGACASAQDLTLRLVNTIDVSAFTELNEVDDSTYIGRYPGAIAYDGINLFLTGIEGLGQDRLTRIVELENFLTDVGVWDVQPVEEAEDVLTPAFASRPGLDWDETQGLLATHDLGPGSSRQVQVFNRPNPNAALQETSVSGADSLNGFSGAAWDLGPEGNGFTLSDGGTGALIGLADFRAMDATTGDSIGRLGPVGVDPLSLETVYLPGVGGPMLAMPGEVDSRWRDVDFNPDGGIAARVTQDLVIAERLPDNSVAGAVIKVAGNTPEASQSLIAGNNVAWLHDIPCLPDDVVLWNERAAGCVATLPEALRLTNRDGSPATLAFVDGAGEPVTAWPLSDCRYDFAWDAANQVLLVTETVSLRIYVFEPDCGTTDCVAELNGDGVLDLADIGVFVTLFNALDPAADFNGDSILDNGDIGAYVALFLAGCP